MSGVNKVIIIGNLGNDPEQRALPNGDAVTNFTVATSEKWKDKQSGQQQEQTEWHRIVCFRKLGEIAGQYLNKGSKVYIEGKLKTRKWQDKESGQDRYATEIVANQMQMLDSKGQQQNDPAQHASGNRNQPNPTSQPSNGGGGSGDFDDDIPFAPFEQYTV